MNVPGCPFPHFPKIYQGNEATCIPVSIKVVLDTMKKWVNGIPDLSVSQIGDKIGTNKDGTVPDTNIENINSLLMNTIPNIEFETDFGSIKWQSIIDDITLANPLQTPVIAVIGQYDTVELGWMMHGVVILYAQNDYTYYWDPFYGEMVVPTNRFFNKWDQLDRFCVRLKHIPRTQTLLEEYPSVQGGGRNE